MLVRHYHTKKGHSGREHVLSLICEKYWIIKRRMAVRRVLSSCFDCKRRQQLPDSQKMSDLPNERVTPGEPAFTFVGLDYFGPFYVKRGSPRVIRSDNGTNLTSGEKELREAIGGWKKAKIGEFLLQKEVRWVFNPPAASTWVGSGNA